MFKGGRQSNQPGAPGQRGCSPGPLGTPGRNSERERERRNFSPEQPPGGPAENPESGFHPGNSSAGLRRLSLSMCRRRCACSVEVRFGFCCGIRGGSQRNRNCPSRGRPPSAWAALAQAPSLPVPHPLFTLSARLPPFPKQPS